MAISDWSAHHARAHDRVRTISLPTAQMTSIEHARVRIGILTRRLRVGGLTNRWSGRVGDKVPSSYVGARAAQLNR